MFVYTVKLNTNLSHHHALEKRFRMADDIYQKTLREILKRSRRRKQDPRYKHAYKLEKGAERNAILKELDADYGLQGKFTFSKWANNYRNARNYAPYIPSDVAGKLGIRAWEAYSRVQFAKGAKKIRLNELLSSFEGKGDSGLIIRNGIFKMGTKQAKFECPVKYKEDDFEIDAMRNQFKYNRLVRKFQYGQWHYYVQMTFDGEPPIKSVGGDGTVGDGTIKRGFKVWNDSKEYLKTKEELAELQRKRAMRRRNQHQTLANKIVTSGNRFVVEQMSFKGLQAKAKEATKSETTGRYRSRKRYGKTIGHRAPAMLVEMIRLKAELQGKTFIKAQTSKVKASQLDHITGQYTKVGLGVRAKTVGDDLVQRDLYSAFLLQHVEDDGYTVNLDACDADFTQFLENQEETMAQLETTLKSTGKEHFAA